MSLSIDGPGVFDTYAGASGSADVPFACGENEHTYILTTTGGDGAPDSETIKVHRAEPLVISFSANTLSIQGGCGQIFQRRLFWLVDHAIGVTISSGGQVLGTYDGRDDSALVPYDCRNSDTVIYTLTTTGPYGPHDSETIEVGYISQN